MKTQVNYISNQLAIWSSRAFKIAGLWLVILAVIARSGARSVAEISAVGLPACFIPLPIGNGEQRVNALPVVEAGGAILIDNADFDVAALVNQVLPILNSPAQITSFSLASKSCGRQDASSRLADVVDHVVEQATKKVN